MRLIVRVMGLTLLDVDWTTDDDDPSAYGETGTPISIGFRASEPDPDRPTWPYEEERA